jgi:hypothetical protein
MMRLRIGLNAVSEATLRVVERLAPRLPIELEVHSPLNLYKAPMMRRLFCDRPITTPWTIWLDDDSFVRRPDWLSMLSNESRLQPGVDMWGKRLFFRGDEHHWKFIHDASWFRGLAPIPDDQADRCRLNFVAGGYWAIRTACLRELDWPDPRLLHFGDDYMLGEAMRQIGAQLGEAVSGVAIDYAPRRAPAETPRCRILC